MNNITEIRQVHFEVRVVEYKLIRKAVKNINIRVKPNGQVLVSANNTVPSDYIDNLIRQKQKYIITALDKFEKRRDESSVYSKEYVSGESFNILGKSLHLKIIQAKDESVRKDDKFIFLTVKDKDDVKRKEKIMNIWLKDLQVKTFEEICKKVHKRFLKYGVEYPDIKIRSMKTRWGSCRPLKGSITLNSRLIGASITCIEYVVTHEFAHFIHPNHSKQFYDFLTKLMPDWKERRKELNKIK